MTKTEIKQNIHSTIEAIEDEKMLVELWEVINYMVNNTVVEWESLSKEEKKSIEEGLKELDDGKTISYEDIKKKFPEWLRK